MDKQGVLSAMRHYTDGKVSIYVFKHGTALIGAEDDTSAKEAIALYNAPREGEGSVFGDMHPLRMDDGNRLVVFTRVELRGEKIQAFGVLSPEDLKKDPSPIFRSPTEVIAGTSSVEETALLTWCLYLRRNRALDAIEREIVERYEPKGVQA